MAGRTVNSRGFEISYDDVGEGPSIVLISGFSQSGGDWWELGYVDRLVALGRRVLVVDPLGHGVSDRPHDPDAYKWPDVALDVVATMDAAGVAQATLWGFSRGAALAASATIDAPARVAALVLGAGGDLSDTPPIAISPEIGTLLEGDWAAFFATPGGSIYAEVTRRYHERVNDPRAFGAALAGRRLFPYDLDLSRISAPSFVYSGSEDEPDKGPAHGTRSEGRVPRAPRTRSPNRPVRHRSGHGDRRAVPGGVPGTPSRRLTHISRAPKRH